MRSRVALGMAVLVVSACGGPAGTASPSAAPSTVTIESGVALAPGWVTASEFDFPLAFRLDAGWSGAHLHGEYSDVTRGEPPDHVSVSVGHPDHIFAGEVATVPATSPEAAWATLRANQNLVVTSPASAMLVGRPGLRADIRVADGVAAQNVFGGEDGDLTLSSGRILRLAIVPFHDELLLIGFEGPAVGFESAAAEAWPVIDSIVEQPA